VDSEVERDELGRLLPGSQLNPSGRPKGTGLADLIKDLVGENAEDLIESYLEIAFKRNSDGGYDYGSQVRMQAMEKVLERGWGRPIQGIDISGQLHLESNMNYSLKLIQERRVRKEAHIKLLKVSNG
jgi:hypothetical protein